MSSIPIPRQMKGRMVCKGVYGKTNTELMLSPITNPIPIPRMPTMER